MGGIFQKKKETGLLKYLTYNERHLDAVTQKFVLHDCNEIIISKIPPFANLKPHCHEAKQFGTSFLESFYFYINNDTIKVDENVIYDLDSNINHSAYNPNANEVIALDIKYFCSNPTEFKNTVINLQWKKITHDVYNQIYQNNSFCYKKFKLISFGKLNFVADNDDYLIPIDGILEMNWADNNEVLRNYNIYQLSANMNYQIKSNSIEAKFIYLTFKN